VVSLRPILSGSRPVGARSVALAAAPDMNEKSAGRTFTGVTFGEILLIMLGIEQAALTSLGTVEGVTRMALDYVCLLAGCP
jgi:hypothetical protein